MSLSSRGTVSVNNAHLKHPGPWTCVCGLPRVTAAIATPGTERTASRGLHLSPTIGVSMETNATPAGKHKVGL